MGMDIVLTVPGPWVSAPEAVTSLASTSKAEVDLAPAHPQLVQQMARASDGWLEEQELTALERHTSTLRLVRPGGSMDAAKSMLRAGAAALDAGGLVVNVESSGLTHSRAEWRRMSARQLAEDLLDAYVSIHASTAGLASRGMAAFGLAEMIMVGSGPEDRGTLEAFLLYGLSDQPSFRDGEAITTSPGRIVYRLEIANGEAVGAHDESTVRIKPLSVWEVAGLRDITAVAAGGEHSLALTAYGTVMAWGCNRDGRLGDGTATDRDVPVEVPGLDGVVEISAGGDHSLALTAAGAVMAWGRNAFGQLGDGTMTSRHLPVRAVGLSGRVIAVAAGHSHSLALIEDGTVVAWGWNAHGQLGNGIDESYSESHSVPSPVSSLSTRVAAIAAWSQSLALLDDGTVAIWGGEGDTGVPTPVPGLARVVALSAGGCLLALLQDGTVWSWGSNWSGQLGDGTRVSRWLPASVAGLPGPVKAVVSGGYESLALMPDGSIYNWGDSPVKVAGLSDVKAASAGTAHNLALMQNGSVAVWGFSLSRRLGQARHHVCPFRQHVRPLRPGRLSALAALAAPCIQLHPRSTTDGVQSGETKLGGRPDLPSSWEWPKIGGVPKAFVAQVNLSNLPALEEQNLLPPAGLLSFFCSVRDIEGDPCTVIYIEPTIELSRRDFPALLDEESWRFDEVALDPELVAAPAPPSSVELNQLDLSSDEWRAYSDGLDERRPSHRVLGYPEAVQDDPRSDENELLLLQVDSDDNARMMWGDAGRIYYLVGRDDLLASRFDRVRLVHQFH